MLLSQACHHWCRPPGSTAIALAAFLRAAGLDSEFRQATTGVGEPTDNGVREVLLDFYARNHPEYANEEKVARIIRSFKRKAQAQRELPDTAARRWDELLWAGFLREGVDVQEDVGRVTGATTIQRMYRGRLGRSTERSRDAARGRYAAARQRGATLALALEREQLGWYSPVQMTRMQGRLDEQSRRLARHKRTIRLGNASSPASFTSYQI